MINPRDNRRSGTNATQRPSNNAPIIAGRFERPRGGYTAGMFQDVTDIAGFADVLGIPTKAVSLIVVKANTKCSSKGCSFDAIKGNRDFCPAHRRAWYPIAGQRGCDMLGPEFMSFSVGKKRVCDCTQTFCAAAGYFPNQEPIYISGPGRDVVLRTPNLFSDERKKKLAGKEFYLYPWHFFPEHLKRDASGKWSLDFNKSSPKSYFDLERNKYPFPPPRNTATRFVNEVLKDSFVRPQDRWTTRGASTLPTWMENIIRLDKINFNEASRAVTPSPATVVARPTIITRQRHAELSAPPPPSPPKPKDPITPKPRPTVRDVNYWKSRALQLEREKQDLIKQHAHERNSWKRKHDDITNHYESEIQRKDAKITDLQKRIVDLEKKLAAVTEELADLRSAKGRPFRFSDLQPGGLLHNYVDAFTFFPTFAQNDAFLEVMNYADGSPGSRPPGDGMLENLRTYSKVSMEERDGTKPPPSLDDDEYQKWLDKRNRALQDDSLTFKDEYFVYCVYVRAGTTQKFAGGLFGISEGRVSDIFHSWSNVLDNGLCQLFPRPTRSQLLRAFPHRTIEADGHARNFLLLDAVEIFTQQSSNPNVANATYSDYKKHATAKWMIGSCPIGCTWDKSVPDANPGKITDPMQTKKTKILREVAFGGTCKTDKGFLVDAEAAHEGVVNDRPQKRQKGQKQQTLADTGNTQKVGNTRITIENVNSGPKREIRYLRGLVPCNQFGIISKVVRIAYLLQNFKKAIIQNNNY